MTTSPTTAARALHATYLRSILHRRLIRGSVGAELISAMALLVWGVALVHTPLTQAVTHFGRIVMRYHPYFAAGMLLGGALHFTVLMLPESIPLVRLRKVLSAAALVLWLEVAQSLLVVGSRAAGFVILATCVLLVYATARKEY